jgi:maltose/moltooligosaccharide transporter
MSQSMREKPELSFGQIWNMCFGFLGIQFGFALQSSNISRIFQTLGADMATIPLLFIAGPITGLIVQPIIGHFSDKTWNGLGRRKPYFFWGAILTTCSLVFMPNSPTLWLAAVMLWVMDASINVTMEPFRAFVGDMLPSKQRTSGYVMQTFFIGVGSVVASMLPWVFTNWFGVENTAPEGMIPDSVRYSFYLGAVAVLIAVGWTIISTKEYSPDEMASFEEPEIASFAIAEQANLEGSDVFSLSKASIWTAAGLLLSFAIYIADLEFQLYILSGGLVVYGVLQIIARSLESNGKRNSFYEACRSVVLMPKTMRQLSVVQFFSWAPMYALWVYTTPAITTFHFGSTEVNSSAFNEGANWASVLSGAYNGFAIVAALLIPLAARKIGLKLTHSINLLIGAAGLLSMILIRDPQLLLLSMVGVGFAWASILSVPYAILSTSVPSKKMGMYMGVFNFFIVIPQLVAATLLGLALKYFFAGEAIYIMGVGSVCWVVAALSMVFVKHDS